MKGNKYKVLIRVCMVAKMSFALNAVMFTHGLIFVYDLKYFSCLLL